VLLSEPDTSFKSALRWVTRAAISKYSALKAYLSAQLRDEVRCAAAGKRGGRGRLQGRLTALLNFSAEFFSSLGIAVPREGSPHDRSDMHEAPDVDALIRATPIQPLSRLSGEAAAHFNARHSSDHGTLRVPSQTRPIIQIPIISRPNKPRVRSLAASGRRPGCPPPRLARPASGSLHTTRREQMQRCEAKIARSLRWRERGAWRNVNAERLGRLQIEDELELRARG
jgi:hypothetical protein